MGSIPVALTIAGFDPSSGAGITSDLKTFAAHGVYGVACISALTVQSTQGVRSVQPLPALQAKETLECLAQDLSLAGVKIGMLGSSSIAREVVRFLTSDHGVERRRAVLDPVFLSSSGHSLLDAEGMQLLRTDLLSSIGWITPNLAELAFLAGTGPIGREEIPGAAGRLKDLAARMGNEALNVVVTGGHLDPPDDYLLTAAGGEEWFPGETVNTTATHGTGCAFSAALLCRIIRGDSPSFAVAQAKAFVSEALRSATPIGKGKGPIHHLFRLQS